MALIQGRDAKRVKSSTVKPVQPPRCRDVLDYEKLEQVGEGQYGKVYKARCRETNQYVALKKVKMESEKEGFPITAIREIKILQNLEHPNIVRLVEIVTDSEERKEKESSSGGDQGLMGDDTSIYMVFEYLDYDLAGLIEYSNRSAMDNDIQVRITSAHVKCYFKQLLEGVCHMHKNKILHRDLKGPNILINRNGQLKIADWGLARQYSEKQSYYTTPVITLWYRPPELLMGSRKYDDSVDMWSCGCILSELVLKKALLPGRDEADQLQKIFNRLGTPKLVAGGPGSAPNPEYTYDLWPSASTCPNWSILRAADDPKPRRLQELFGGSKDKLHRVRAPIVGREAGPMLDLLENLLHLDPKKRISAETALDHDYFWTAPLPVKPEDLPRFGVTALHELDARNLAKEMRQKEDEKRKQRHSQAHNQGHSSHSSGTLVPPLPTKVQQAHSCLVGTCPSSYVHSRRGEVLYD